jgi:hypothetical protein
VIWLQSPRWPRWSAAFLIVIGALWSEFSDATVEYPFAVVAIAPGEEISPDNTETRTVPEGLFDPATPSPFATRAFAPGEPILASGTARERTTARSDWWALEIGLPAGAQRGDEVQIVLLDTGEVVGGIVHATPDEDPLGAGTGSVAVPAASSASVASAAAEGRAVVLVSAG